jgi:hypothetical protein
MGVRAADSSLDLAVQRTFRDSRCCPGRVRQTVPLGR